MQSTAHLLMIRPVDFKYNIQTAANNKFQQQSANLHVQQQALAEFDQFVAMLRQNEVDVTVIDDTLTPETPDSIFPNNWVSFHDDGQVILYPMFSENRRAERRADIISEIGKHFTIHKTLDLSTYEQQDLFLEGTGSLVLDRNAKIAYACLSLRTHHQVIAHFCKQTGYRAVVFHAVDDQGFPIYHTNVMMCVGEAFAVVCFDSIPDQEERELLTSSLKNSGKTVIAITFNQMNHFAGNMLEVKNQRDETLIVMSEQAYLSLNAGQRNTLAQYGRLLYAPLYTIEQNGGGSARCMLAEIHLP